MKKSQIALIVIGFILVALMATNPSIEEHKEAVMEKVSAAIEINNSNGNAFRKISEQLGQTIGKALIDKEIKREDYLIFSIIKAKYLFNPPTSSINQKKVGIGILGNVYLSDIFSNRISEKIIESSNPIIGKTIKIGYLEVAEKDFPIQMNWDDAKKQCENLGRRWRLPTKDELTTLYINRDKISNLESDYFAGVYHWSSTEYDSNHAWLRRINFGEQLVTNKSSPGNVRAVRLFL
jgi:hypothetical protein